MLPLERRQLEEVLLVLLRGEPVPHRSGVRIMRQPYAGGVHVHDTEGRARWRSRRPPASPGTCRTPWPGRHRRRGLPSTWGSNSGRSAPSPAPWAARARPEPRRRVETWCRDPGTGTRRRGRARPASLRPRRRGRRSGAGLPSGGRPALIVDTGVPDELGGRGIGGRLVRGARSPAPRAPPSSRTARSPGSGCGTTGTPSTGSPWTGVRCRHERRGLRPPRRRPVRDAHAVQRGLRGLHAHRRPVGAPPAVHDTAGTSAAATTRPTATPPPTSTHATTRSSSPTSRARTGGGATSTRSASRSRAAFVRAPGRRRSRARRSTRSSMPIRPPVRVLALTSGTTRAGVPADRPPPQCCAAAARRPADMGGVGSASNSINCRSGSGLVRVRFWSSVERQGSARPACFPPQSRASPVGSAAAETPSARRHGEGLPRRWKPLSPVVGSC